MECCGDVAAYWLVRHEESSAAVASGPVGARRKSAGDCHQLRHQRERRAVAPACAPAGRDTGHRTSDRHHGGGAGRRLSVGEPCALPRATPTSSSTRSPSARPAGASSPRWSSGRALLLAWPSRPASWRPSSTTRARTMPCRCSPTCCRSCTSPPAPAGRSPRSCTAATAAWPAPSPGRPTTPWRNSAPGTTASTSCCGCYCGSSPSRARRWPGAACRSPS